MSNPKIHIAVMIPSGQSAEISVDITGKMDSEAFATRYLSLNGTFQYIHPLFHYIPMITKCGYTDVSLINCVIMSGACAVVISSTATWEKLQQEKKIHHVSSKIFYQNRRDIVGEYLGAWLTTGGDNPHWIPLKKISWLLAEN